MIVFDTNVLSEPLRPAPDAGVLRWMRAQSRVVVTAVSVAELLTGARALPEGARRERLVSAITGILTGTSVLSFDEAAAHAYAAMQEMRRRSGRPLSVEDGMIAAITAVHGATLATRNIADFVGLGIPLIDPWTSS